ncbi:MAG: riboflavin biosynthesis protein RibF [Paludibacteraceae bacterium]|nr:riboflavin biosynthesis protein RibF [Paludibacteraceae bacterium]
MKVITNFKEFEAQPSAVAIGFFDGVHKGHVTLLHQLTQQAKLRGLQSVVITFAKHPREILGASYVPKLLTIKDERIDLIAKHGVDVCVVLDANKDLFELSSRYFMKHYLVEKLQTKYLLVGYDHHFGNDRENGYDYYKQLGEACDIDVDRTVPFQVNNTNVSSSAIRKILGEGQVKQAINYLGYPYFICGTVVSGQKVGRTIGFPTANIAINDVRKLLPKHGVYAVRAKLDNDDTIYNGMLYIGERPTFVTGSIAKSIEVHLFNFSGDIYHRKIRIDFLQYVRDEARFDSPDSLARQLQIDRDDLQLWFKDQKFD